MLKKEELLSLFEDYNAGRYSFAQVFLASGMEMKEFISFMKKHGIKVSLNVGFINEGNVLEEDVLNKILEMNE